MERHGECMRSTHALESVGSEKITERGVQWRGSRPGRKLAAEKRRVARGILQEFYDSEQFSGLPRKVQLAMFLVCPRAKVVEKKERLDVSA